MDYEELVKQLAEMGVLPGYQSRLAEQMKMAQQLRQTPLPEGRQVGHIFVASHPLENVAAAMQRTMGMQQVQGLQGQAPAWAGTEAGLLGREQQNRAGYLRALVQQAQAEQLRRSIPPLIRRPEDGNG